MQGMAADDDKYAHWKHAKLLLKPEVMNLV